MLFATLTSEGNMTKRAVLLTAVLLASTLANPQGAPARTDWTGSPLPSEVQIRLEKAGRLCKSAKYAQATPMILSALDQANDIPKCLAIATFTEPYAYPMMDARRQCLTKALSLCSTRQDYIEIALKSRQYQFFEITRQAINALTQSAKTVPDLFDLARKSQEVALNDVAHQAMEKAYSGIRSVPEAIKFAGEVKSMGMDDLTRKVEKDLIDDEDSPHQLCYIVNTLRPLEMKDLTRYGLKKALDKAMQVQDFMDIYEAARGAREPDIFKIAEYRGRKLRLLNQIKHDREEYQRQLQAWQEGSQQDLAKQQEEADRELNSMRQTGAGSGGAGGAGSAPDAPGSGF